MRFSLIEIQISGLYFGFFRKKIADLVQGVFYFGITHIRGIRSVFSV